MIKEEVDKFYIRKTFDLALKGKFTVHPNPMVGAIIVKNKKIISRGFHKNPGSPHAEQVAIRKAGNNVKNATLYVNLEPCCHYGRTPPCLDLIIQKKISRVVISSIDPNPLVNGFSIKQLRKAGIEVKINVLRNEAVHLNKKFFSKYINKRPFITAKSGISLDGKISLSNGISQWITSNDSRKDVQKERATSSLILTSSNTILADNPKMSVRDKLLKQKILKQPDVAILDSNLRIPLSHNIFSDENRIIYLFTNKKNTKKKYKSNVYIISNMADNDKIDIKKCIKYLASQDINNIFIESGPKLIESFLKLKLIDELLLYIAPIIIGHTGKNFSGVSYITKLSKKIKFTINDMISIGNDLKVRMVK